MTATQELTILGPNLIDQTKGDFHVHRTGCRDIRRGVYGASAISEAMTATFTSKDDVVREVYPPGDFDYAGPEDDAYPHYRDSLWFAPCVTVPESEPAAAGGLFQATYRVTRTNGTVFYSTREVIAADFVEAAKTAYGTTNDIVETGWQATVERIEVVR